MNVYFLIYITFSLLFKRFSFFSEPFFTFSLWLSLPTFPESIETTTEPQKWTLCQLKVRGKRAYIHRTIMDP